MIADLFAKQSSEGQPVEGRLSCIPEHCCKPIAKHCSQGHTFLQHVAHSLLELQPAQSCLLHMHRVFLSKWHTWLQFAELLAS